MCEISFQFPRVNFGNVFFYIIEQTCLNSHILSNEMRGVENKDVTRNMRQKDDVLDQVEWVGGMMAG